jgi:hypothetical protein
MPVCNLSARYGKLSMFDEAPGKLTKADDLQDYSVRSLYAQLLTNKPRSH